MLGTRLSQDFGGIIGIVGGGAAADAGVSAISNALEGTDKANTSFAVKPEASKELAEAKIMAVVLDPSTLGGPEGMDFASDVGRIVEARLCQELLGMGYDVIGRDELALEATGKSVLDAARDHNADLLVGGSISRSVGAAGDSRGLFLRKGKAEVETLVKSATVRVTSCKSVTQIVNGMISYKKGKPAAVAGTDLAIVLRQAARATAAAEVVQVQ